jgi:hypothetical protein
MVNAPGSLRQIVARNSYEPLSQEVNPAGDPVQWRIQLRAVAELLASAACDLILGDVDDRDPRLQSSRETT